jgi:arylsulfatase A-like enzyme
MKAIFVCFDTLNRHMLPPYGCDWVHAPNFARLAERSVTFENAFVGSMPCMPARRELHTGRYNFLHRSWGPLEPFDESMPQLLSQHGVYTHIVTDHQHYWEDGGGSYLPRYRSFEMVRGQEGDPWKGQVADPQTPESPKKQRGALWRQDWVNRAHTRGEEDMPQAQVFALAAEFLRENAGEDNWFLQIETFDPHEPFFTQQRFKDLYPHQYDGPHFDWPDYAPVNEPRDQIEHMRYEYAALVSMCDHYLGQVLDLMDAQNLWDDTLLLVSTDHGFLLGEHDWWAKSIQPYYNEVAQIPLFVWDPRSKVRGERRRSVAQWIDFAPTLLEFFGAPIPETMQGAPLRERVERDAPARPAGLFGIFGGHANVSDGRYVYMRAPADPENGPLFEYTLMPTHMRSRFSVAELQDISMGEPFAFTKGVRPMKIAARTMANPHSFGTMLFDIESDPQQEQPLVDEAVERHMIGLLVEWMRWNDAPAEQFTRLGLPLDGAVGEAHLLLARQHGAVLQARAKRVQAPPYAGPGAAFLTMPLREVFAVAGAEERVRAHFPQLLDSAASQMFGAASLAQIASYMPATLTPERLAAFATDLAASGEP